MSYILKNVSSKYGMVKLPDSIWQYAGWEINDELNIIVKHNYDDKGRKINCSMEIVKSSDLDYNEKTQTYKRKK
jgi:hypothetical protein